LGAKLTVDNYGADVRFLLHDNPKADYPQATQFLPFSSVLHFTKSSLSAYRGFLIKADLRLATQLRS
jgi:hypothetical protein